MFQINDYIVYGSNGVCKILEIGLLDMLGVDDKKIYYTLKPICSKTSTIYTPINNKSSMRKTISKEDALKLINDIPNIGMIWEKNNKNCEEIYREAMKKYDCREWIRIIKTLYLRQKERLDSGKKITSTDEKYLHSAKEYLYTELSIPLNISKEEVESFITDKLNN